MSLEASTLDAMRDLFSRHRCRCGRKSNRIVRSRFMCHDCYEKFLKRRERKLEIRECKNG